MREAEQRTIEELAARYELEPSLRDIYVEGRTDASILSWFFRTQAIDRAVVYDIGTVYVPAEAAIAHGGEDNNRGRVIALAFELEAQLRPDSRQAVCVIDADLDRYLGIDYHNRLLRLTDFTSMEMYLFDEQVLEKFVALFLHGYPERPTEILKRVSGVLRELFLIRYANRAMQLGLKELGFQRCVRRTCCGVELDSQEYMKRYLGKNSRLDMSEAFAATVEKGRELLPDEARHSIHGHDFVEVLAWYLSSSARLKQLCKPDIVGRSLWTCVEARQLEEWPLFRSLLRGRLKRGRLVRPVAGDGASDGSSRGG